MDGGTKIFLIVYNLVFWITCVLSFRILIKDWEKCKESPSSDFYFGKKSIRKVLVDNGDIQFGWFFVWFVYMLMLFSSASILADEPLIRNCWKGLGTRVDGAPGIMFSGIAIFSFIGVFINFNKYTGIGIDAETIVKEYKIKRNIKIMALMFIQGVVCDFLCVLVWNITGAYSLYFGIRFLVLIAFGVYMILFIKILWNFIDILFGEKIANRLIRKLYEELWYLPVKKINCKEKTVDVFKKLLQEYIETCSTIKLLTGIKEFEFNTNVRIGLEKGNRYNALKVRSRLFLFCLMLMLYLAGGIGIWIQLPRETDILWNLLVVGGILGTLILISCCCFSEGVTIGAIAIFFGRYGYQFTVQKNICEKSFMVKRYVREVAFIGKNKYYMFVYTTKNIIALFKMICTEKNKKEIKQVIDIYKAEMANNENVKILLYIMDNLLTAEKIFEENEKIDFNHSFGNDEKYMEIAQEFLVDVTGSFTNSGTVKRIELKSNPKKNKKKIRSR